MPSSPGSETASRAEALPTAADVAAAAARLRGTAVRTPLLEAPDLNALVGGRILVKAEMLQRTGSFKFRGAYNRISRLNAAERRGGVVAFSSGNHAQGVAAAAGIVGIPSVIVMPDDAPQVKIDKTRGLGAEVVLYERDDEVRARVADEIAAERGAVLVRPFDDTDIIAGQGTVGLEIAEQAAEAGIEPDAALVPCGGGGLISGTTIALQDRWPDLPVYAVEPEGFDDTTRSLAAGRRVRNERGPTSFCDSLLSPLPGEITFAINHARLKGGLTVSDRAVAAAMAAAFGMLRLVVEPGGAVALAAALEAKFDCRGKTVVVVCSGGNVAPETFTQALATAKAA